MDPALEAAVADVTRFFLDLRGVGHFVGPEDSRVIEKWCRSGLGVEAVLRAVHAGAVRLHAGGEALRNASRVDKEVSVAVKAARSRLGGLGGAPAPAEAGADRVARWIEGQLGILDALRSDAEVDGDAGWVALCEQTADALVFEREARRAVSAAVPLLLGIGRRFYDGVWELLGVEARAALRADAEAALEGWIRPMSREVREETVRELIVTALRERLGAFLPRELLDLWDEGGA